MSAIRYGAEMLQPYTGTFSFKLTVNIERIFWQKIALMPNNWLKMHGYPMRRRVKQRVKEEQYQKERGTG